MSSTMNHQIEDHVLRGSGHGTTLPSASTIARNINTGQNQVLQNHASSTQPEQSSETQGVNSSSQRNSLQTLPPIQHQGQHENVSTPTGPVNEESNSNQEQSSGTESRQYNEVYRVLFRTSQRGGAWQNRTNPYLASFRREHRPYQLMLINKCRWLYFLHFAVDNRGLTKVISEVYGIKNQRSIDSYMARSSSVNFFLAWKNTSLTKMLDHVKEIKYEDEMNDGVLLGKSFGDEDFLYRYFSESFSPERFFRVFYWTEPIVDYHRSTELGKWYMKNIYANLAVQVKLYHDAVENPALDSGLNQRWIDISDFWDYMADYPEYASVDGGDFYDKSDLRRKADNNGRHKPRKVMRFDNDVPKKTARRSQR